MSQPKHKSWIHHASVVGHVPSHYAPIVDDLVFHLDGFRYAFAGPEFFEIVARAPKQGAQVYWYEILARSHIAATTSVLRLHRWWRVIDHAIETSNYLGFAAGLRSFLEASADTFYTLRNVPGTLARDASYIRAALAGRAEALMVNQALEESLIHFSHASKRYADVGPQQKALHTSKYLETLKGPEYENLKACYAELCESVHPAADSVLLFLTPLTNTGSLIELQPGCDAEIIKHLVTSYQDGINHAWELGFNMPLITLKVTNAVAPADLHIAAIDRLNLNNMPSWRRIEPLLRT